MTEAEKDKIAMTRSEREEYVRGLLRKAETLRRINDRRGSDLVMSMIASARKLWAENRSRR